MSERADEAGDRLTELANQEPPPISEPDFTPFDEAVAAVCRLPDECSDCDDKFYLHLTEVLIPAGYVTTVYDPVYKLSEDGTRYLHAPSNTPTAIPEPGLPFSLVFRAEPGKEDVLLQAASAYEAASKRRIPPPAFPPLAVEQRAHSD